jgi:AcrR family transcriptional regulator
VNVVHFVYVPHKLGRVEQKRETRTAAILDQAMNVLEADGLDALTMGRLAASLDVVPTALYRYFPSKDALLSALQRRAIGLVHTRMREALALIAQRTKRMPPDAACLAKVLGVAVLYLDLPRSEPQTHFLLAVLVGDPRPLLSPAEGKRTAPVLLALLAEVEALFREAVDTRALDSGDSLERTLAFWAVLQGTLALEKARRIAKTLPDPSGVAMDAVAALLVAWGAARRTVALARKKTIL